MELLKLPLSEDHRVNRLNDLCDRWIAEMGPKELNLIVEAVYRRTVELAGFIQDAEEDTSHADLAAQRLWEASSWLDQLD